MDNLISREAAIAELMKMVEQHMTDSTRGDYLHYTGVKAMLEYLPAVDAVPVVRCKDCKYALHNIMFVGDIWCGGICREPDFYCSDGKRLTNGVKTNADGT